MASDLYLRRLQKQLMAIKRAPIDNVVVSAMNFPAVSCVQR